MACIAAGAMYLFYLPRAKPPETWIAQGARLVPVQALNQEPKRDGRPISLANGVSELELVAGILVVTVLAGRYGFRLRL